MTGMSTTTNTMRKCQISSIGFPDEPSETKEVDNVALLDQQSCGKGFI